MVNNTTICRSMMFRGKYLPGFFEQYAPLYADLVRQHGVEKVYSVYDYFFTYLSNMHWGQYFVWKKMCPNSDYTQLVMWVLECIYESDLFSQFAFRWAKVDGVPDEELRVYCVEPTKHQKQLWQYFLRTDARYSLIDWFGRLRQDPKALPEIKSEWLLLTSGNEIPEEDSDELGASLSEE